MLVKCIFRRWYLDERTVRWTDNWLDGRAQRAVLSGAVCLEACT